MIQQLWLHNKEEEAEEKDDGDADDNDDVDMIDMTTTHDQLHDLLHKPFVPLHPLSLYQTCEHTRPFPNPIQNRSERSE